MSQIVKIKVGTLTTISPLLVACVLNSVIIVIILIVVINVLKAFSFNQILMAIHNAYKTAIEDSNLATN